MAKKVKARFDNLVMSLRSSDADELAELTCCWDLEFQRLERGSFAGGLLQAHLGGIQFVRADWSGPLRIRGSAPPGTVAFGLALSPDDALWHGYGCDANCLMVNGDRAVDMRTPQDYRMAVVALDRGLLLEAAAEDDRETVGQLLETQRVLELQEPIGRDLAGFLKATFQRVESSPDLVLSPEEGEVVARQLTRRLALAIASSPTGNRRSPRASKPAQLVRQAEAYILDRLNQPLALGDICAAVGASERTLLHNFQQVLGMSPIAYLKARRLQNVRRQLKTADPETTRVGDVARHWGFHHMGWFSSNYRAMFQESPSETLERQHTLARSAR